MNLDAWKNRYTVRRFDTEHVPDKKLITHLVDCIEHVPLQLGNIDHVWTVLGPDDADLKRWLVDNIYNVKDENMGHKEYFTMLAEAPYVLHSFRVTWDPSITRLNKMNEVIRNNAFHAGVIVSEALHLGLDVAQICCTDGLLQTPDGRNGYKKKVWKKYIEFMWNRHRPVLDVLPISPDMYNIDQPLISIAVGKGLPNTDYDYTPYKDGVSFTGQKKGKPFNNCMDLTNAN